jgi:hypothetical protein
MMTPADVYTKSERAYNGDFDILEYPPGFLPRKVMKNGTICLWGLRISVGVSLRGLILGLKPLENGKYHVFLARLYH